MISFPSRFSVFVFFVCLFYYKNKGNYVKETAEKLNNLFTLLNISVYVLVAFFYASTLVRWL